MLAVQDYHPLSPMLPICTRCNTTTILPSSPEINPLKVDTIMGALTTDLVVLAWYMAEVDIWDNFLHMHLRGALLVLVAPIILLQGTIQPTVDGVHLNTLS